MALPGPDLLGFLITNAASSGVEQYRQEAAEFRAIAETETNDTLRCQFLELARRYDELAENYAKR